MDNNQTFTGADLISAFIAAKCFPNVFVVTGGAAAFMIDALERNSETNYTCYQHEQSASMAADAVFRVAGKVGVTMATSGPGATNLITGIASSWFDSVPTLHITGQVNDRESKSTLGINVRQAGFQETDIALMVKSITKYSKKVTTVTELAHALSDSLSIALSGRMGPVLVDVPMNVQQEIASAEDFEIALRETHDFSDYQQSPSTDYVASIVSDFFSTASRPLVVFGGGLEISGTTHIAQNWCEKHSIPYVSSWAGLSSINRDFLGFQGTQGVYGLRHANWCVQSADKILVLGSRLDNRQRTGNPRAYAPFADVLVLDIDREEIKKLELLENYRGLEINLKEVPALLEDLSVPSFENWQEEVLAAASQQDNELSSEVSKNELDPYAAFQRIDELVDQNTQYIADTGATLCWLMQSLSVGQSHVFTAGGNSPMGYSLPAAIGAQIVQPSLPIVCVIGDGGFQMNIQELQTAKYLNLPITIVVANNAGYGIIKQFQDANTDSRYAATGNGYSVPDFGAISLAYGIPHTRITQVSQLTPELLSPKLQIIELIIPEDAKVTPKAEGNHFLHDQFPFQIERNPELPFAYPSKPSELGK